MPAVVRAPLGKRRQRQVLLFVHSPEKCIPPRWACCNSAIMISGPKKEYATHCSRSIFCSALIIFSSGVMSVLLLMRVEQSKLRR